MRAIIIAEDNNVLVDGEPQTVDCSALLADNIRAVQWYDTFGEVEYVGTFVDAPVLDAETNEPTGETVKQPHREPNLPITDFTPYQQYVDAWQAEKSKPPAPLPPAPKFVPAPEFLDMQNRLLKLEGKQPMTVEEFASYILHLNKKDAIQ
jgi:hypothetical protein